ncbi:uncharacterized protein [Halyomorpha halys]|uniref:uncharacterized protein n=1 Tax=Halyomorpha halys TaxID=286706 RepID=UPI0006D50539|nr:uncharacterized protein LOC106688555 [Halyomorpha halys]
MSYVSVLLVLTLVQYSFCSPHSGEDHSSEEDHDISYEHDGWRYAPRTGNRSRQLTFPSSTLMNMLAMIANGFGRQTTPSTEDCGPSVANVRPSPQGFGQGRPSHQPSPQPQVLRPVQEITEPCTNETWTTQGPPTQYNRPQGGWGVHLMDPNLNLTQLQG